MADTYDLKSSLPNKLLQDDGTVTDIAGKPVISSIEAYDSKPALPNKFLNPDGTYSTLNEIIASMVDTSIYIIVDELPAEGNPQKIYLVSNGDGTFNEYRWTGTTWDPIGMLEFDLEDYSTTEEVQQAIATALQSAKDYTDNKIGSFVNYSMYNWDGQSSEDNPNNITLFQQILNDHNNGKNVLITMSSHMVSISGNLYNSNVFVFDVNMNTILLSNIPSYVINSSVFEMKKNEGSSKSNITSTYNRLFIRLNPSDTTKVQAVEVTTFNNTYNYLDTDANYITPFTPTSPGHPVTKQYVDEHSGVDFEWDGNSSNANPNNLELWSNILKAAATKTVLVKGPSCLFVIHQNQNEAMTNIYYSLAERDIDYEHSTPVGFEVVSTEVTTSDNNYTVSNVTGMIVYSNKSLPMYNQTVQNYTPTYAYHPATKKYVDDSITNNITNVLGGEY